MIRATTYLQHSDVVPRVTTLHWADSNTDERIRRLKKKTGPSPSRTQSRVLQARRSRRISHERSTPLQRWRTRTAHRVGERVFVNTRLLKTSLKRQTASSSTCTIFFPPYVGPSPIDTGEKKKKRVGVANLHPARTQMLLRTCGR